MRIVLPLVLFLLFGAAQAAHASSTGGTDLGGLTTALNKVKDTISGPIAIALGIISLVVGGLIWAFSGNEHGMKRVGTVLFGVGIATNAAALFAGLGFGSALV